MEEIRLTTKESYKFFEEFFALLKRNAQDGR